MNIYRREDVTNDGDAMKDGENEGGSFYQTLNLDEMNYESMYSKIATVKKDTEL